MFELGHTLFPRLRVGDVCTRGVGSCDVWPDDGSLAPVTHRLPDCGNCLPFPQHLPRRQLLGCLRLLGVGTCRLGRVRSVHGGSPDFQSPRSSAGWLHECGRPTSIHDITAYAAQRSASAACCYSFVKRRRKIGVEHGYTKNAASPKTPRETGANRDRDGEQSPIAPRLKSSKAHRNTNFAVAFGETGRLDAACGARPPAGLFDNGNPNRNTCGGEASPEVVRA